MIKKLTAGKEILKWATDNGVAVGAFNFSNMETLQAIVEAAVEKRSPIILQVSESAINYMGIGYVTGMVEVAVDTAEIPIALHLDHGKNFDICKLCIDNGFSSVMIDKSSSSFAENVRQTKEVVDYAQKFGVAVEGELGILTGIEDDVRVAGDNSLFTNPVQALDFIEATGISSLAIAIGTSHGLNKGKTACLDIDRLIAIKDKVSNFPLVLHGASSIYPDITDICNQFGAIFRDASGINTSDIKAAISHGINKINIDTDLRLAFMAGLRRSLYQTSESIDIRMHLNSARLFTKDLVVRKLEMFKVS
ncbi:MAG: class II fructose-bisphosphate aldolase [Holosporales bacterium]|nr:class II fructose-bisphosphate aldolase [Holosporales bacterium]